MSKFHPLKVQEIRKETEDAVSVVLEVPDELKEAYQFKQGQYLTFKKQINGEEIRRNYSVCVSPLENELRVAVKKVSGGKFSTFANEVLKVGDVLETMTPMGRFFTELKPENEKNYVGFAGGSGITPIMSILKTVLQVEPKSSFTLFYGNRGFDSIIFREAIESLKNEYMNRLTIHHIFSEEKLEGELFNGFITVEKCEQFAKYLFDVNTINEFFICGPEPMMLAIRDALQSLGVDNKKIHVELFTTPGQKQDFGMPKPGGSIIDPSKESQVTVILDGVSFDFKLTYGAESILDKALKQGADLPFACKGGVCATCKAKLLEGEVEMEVNYALEQDELEAGYILTCQSHPRTEKLVVDYDH